MKPRILRQAKQQVHILHRLTSRALDHIIKRGNDDQRPRPGIKVQRNIAKIAAPHIAQVCGFPRIQHTDEPLSMISILVGLAQLRLCYALLQAGIHRRDNPPVERQQVRHKHNLELFTGHVGERLLDLRRMAVRRNLIRENASLQLGKCAVSLGERPEPVTPDFESITIPCGSMSPSRRAGASPSATLVG